MTYTFYYYVKSSLAPLTRATVYSSIYGNETEVRRRLWAISAIRYAVERANLVFHGVAPFYTVYNETACRDVAELWADWDRKIVHAEVERALPPPRPVTFEPNVALLSELSVSKDNRIDIKTEIATKNYDGSLVNMSMITCAALKTAHYAFEAGIPHSCACAMYRNAVQSDSSTDAYMSCISDGLLEAYRRLTRRFIADLYPCAQPSPIPSNIHELEEI